LAIVGHQSVARRLGTLTAGSLDAVDAPGGRRTIWNTVAKAIPEYLVFGSGMGSHREVYPIYLEWTDSPEYFSHAECGYLQVTLEGGIAGFGLLMAGIGLCGYWCIDGLARAPSERILVCLGAVSAGLAASVAHSLVDFVWYIPGCTVLVAGLAACACRLWQLANKRPARRRTSVPLSRNMGVTVLAALVVTGAWMLKNRLGPVLAEPHWERCLKLSQDADAPLPFAMIAGETAASHAEARSSVAPIEKTVDELKQVVRWDPSHARAQLRLAKAYVWLFHEKQRTSANVMSVRDIRDAVIKSRADTVPPDRRLDSRPKLETWLIAAIGEHYRYLDLALSHTRRALAFSPLLGDGYLLLKELRFLEGARTPAELAYVSQALRVRPFDGAVLLDAGSEAIRVRDYDRGLTFWRDSFRHGPVYQERIIDMIAGLLEPSLAIDLFLRFFQPDLNGLRLLDRRYGQLASPEQMAPLRIAYAEAIEAEVRHAKGQEAATLWLEAMGQYRKLDMPKDRLRCGQNALRLDPNSFRARHNLALCLADLGQFPQAKEHLQWCLKRKPDDPLLSRAMEHITRKETLMRTTAQHPINTY
jgi:tetratricopeptide (TPR) repeat protein